MRNKYFLLFIGLLVIFIFILYGQTKYNTRTQINGNYLILGYSTNLPKQIIGFSFLATNYRRIGLYFDMKSGLPFRSGSDDFYENISVYLAETIWGDRLIATDDNWLSLNGGITKTLFKNFIFYGGMGISFYSAYRQYYDEFEILGDNGRYWIEDKEKSTIKPNILGGFLFPFQEWRFQIGIEMQPFGITLGIGYAFNL